MVMAVTVLKIFGTKVSYFTVLYELTKNERFLSPFIGGGWKFVCGVIRSVQFTLVDRFLISSMVEVLFLLNQENSYIMFN